MISSSPPTRSNPLAWIGEAKVPSSSWTDQSIWTGFDGPLPCISPVRARSPRKSVFSVTGSAVGVNVAAGTSNVGATVTLAVASAVAVSLGSDVGFGNGASVGSAVSVGVAVSDEVPVGVTVSVLVGSGVLVSVRVADGAAMETRKFSANWVAVLSIGATTAVPPGAELADCVGWGVLDSGEGSSDPWGLAEVTAGCSGELTGLAGSSTGDGEPSRFVDGLPIEIGELTGVATSRAGEAIWGKASTGGVAAKVLLDEVPAGDALGGVALG